MGRKDSDASYERALARIVVQFSVEHGLTPREAEVLPHLVEDRTNKEIAGVLGVEIETVRSHARSVLGKLGVSRRGGLARVLLAALADNVFTETLPSSSRGPVARTDPR